MISVPNVRCLKVRLPLLFRGEWRNCEDGILDRTHLRFFTRESALTQAADSNLRLERCIAHQRLGTRLEKLHRWTLGRLSDFTPLQYLIAASRPP